MEGGTSAKKPTLKYKGKFITQNQLDKRLKWIAKIAEKTKLKAAEAAAAGPADPPGDVEAENAGVDGGKVVENVGDITKDKVVPPRNTLLQGERLVDMRVFAGNLKCCRCQQVLSLQDATHERKMGLCSAFHVRCHQCKIVTEVSTSSMHFEESTKSLPDVNRQVVFGAIAAGVSLLSLNKFLGSMGLPTLSRPVFKRYRDELDAEEDPLAETSGAADVSGDECEEQDS